jgi:hypothetical protein
VVQASDNTVADLWNLSTTPSEVQTLLQSRTEAETEAIRRLGIWGARRLVLSFETVGKFLRLSLGAPVTLTHTRFGLSTGKSGQVVGKTTDWLGHRVKFEVLI